MEQLGARERDTAPTRMSMSKLVEISGVPKNEVTSNVCKVARTAMQYRQMAQSLKSKLILARRKSAKLRKLFDSKTCNLINDLQISAATKLIVMGELRNLKKKSKGRDWTVDDKVFWLSFYKRSPKAYRFLKHYIALPSEQTLKNLLGKILLEPGIMYPCLTLLKDMARTLKPIDRKCVVLFDEMYLRGRLWYNVVKRLVSGFEDFGPDGRTHLIADHALMFMVQGLNTQWILPIAFHFVSKTCPTAMLKTCLKSVIKTLADNGLQVVASVSDQGPTNQSTIKELKAESGDSVFYCVAGARIVHIWDVPHLMKNIRNNLLSSNLEFQEGKEARWRDIIDYFNLDNSLCKMSVLTLKHVNPKGRDKMRVSLAAQALGSRTADGMESLHRVTNGLKLPLCMDTVQFIRDMDFYFDLCNGPRASGSEKKKATRVDVTEGSHHLKEWADMKAKMGGWTFIRKKDRSRHKPPCLHGWMENADSFRFLWLKLKREGFQKLRLRNLNQDPLENFFGLIRQCGGSSTDLTCELFISALKTCMISRYSSFIKGKNCLDDSSVFLGELKIFLENPKPQVERKESLVRGDVPQDLTPVSVNNPVHRLGVERLWASVLSKFDWKCEQCRQLLTTSEPSRHVSLLSTFDIFPSTALVTLFLKVQSVFERTWRLVLYREPVLEHVTRLCLAAVNWSPVFCALHQNEKSDLLEKVSEHLINLKIAQVNKKIKAGVSRYTRQATSNKNADGLRPDEEELELDSLEAELLEASCAGFDTFFFVCWDSYHSPSTTVVRASGFLFNPIGVDGSICFGLQVVSSIVLSCHFVMFDFQTEFQGRGCMPACSYLICGGGYLSTLHHRIYISIYFSGPLDKFHHFIPLSFEPYHILNFVLTVIH